MIGLAEQFSKSLVSKTGRTGDFAMNSAIDGVVTKRGDLPLEPLYPLSAAN
jgi:hypothetical protein